MTHRCYPARRALAALYIGMLLAAPVVHAQVPGEIRGRVIDAQALRPIPGARIEVAGRAEYGVAALDGSFVLRGLDPRAFVLHARAIGYTSVDTEVVVANGRITDIEFVLHLVARQLPTTVARADRDTAGAPSFDRQAIEASGRRDLGELLQTVPGVVVTQAGGPGSPSHISIRGSGANEVLVLVNGSPINSAITGEADLSTITLEGIDRVTVLTGAQSARYGGRAMAGVVMVETRRADPELSGMVSAGAWGERNASLTAGQTQSAGTTRVGESVVGDLHDVDGDFPYTVPRERGGGSATRVNGDAQTAGALATASLDGPSGAFQLRTEWQTNARGLPGSIVQPSTTGHEQGSRLSGSVDGQWGFAGARWTANGNATREHLVVSDPAPPFGSSYDDAVDARTVVLSTSFTVGSARHELTVGGEGHGLDVRSSMLEPGAPHWQRQLGTWAAARDVHTIGGTTEVAADLSARADWDSFVDGAVLSPRVGFTVTHGPASSSLSLGDGYTPPSLADQFFHEGVLVRPNPNLHPEHVRHDIEWRTAWRDTRIGALNVGAEVAAYRADVDGMILWLPDFRYIWSPQNFDVTRRGWETSAHIGLPSLDADARGSLSRSEVRYTGSVLTGQVAYRPRLTGTVVGRVTRWRTRVEWSTRYVGARRTVAGSALNLLDPYWLNDLTVSRSIAHGPWYIDVSLGLDNVLNRSAAMLVDYPFPGRSWTVAFRTRRGGPASHPHGV